MKNRQFENIQAWKAIQADGTSRVVAFHTERLETALLSEAMWDQMDLSNNSHSLQEIQKNSELDELRAWSVEPAAKRLDVKGSQIVRALTVNVTQICNLHCVYCAAGGDGTYGDPIKKIALDKTLPQLEFFMRKLAKGESFRLTFLGGEPLLHPEAMSLMSELARRLAKEQEIELHLVVVTNGTLFTPANIELLSQMHAEVTISLDGPAAINDVLRPTRSGRGKTDEIVLGIQALLERRSELGRVGASGVFGARNPDLLAASEFYRSLGLDWYDFTFDHLEKRPEVSQAFTLQMKQLASEAFDRGGEAELRKIKLFDGYFDQFDSQVPNFNYCGAGKSFLMVDARNQLYPCPWMVGKPQEMLGHGLDVWADKIAKYADDLVNLNNCQNCWARNICGGGCMFIHQNQTGDKHKADTNFCERTRDLIALSLLYYEQSRLKIASAAETLIEPNHHKGVTNENVIHA